MDPIADFLSQIKNAQQADKETVKTSASKLKLSLAKILVKAGYLESVEKKGRGFRRFLVVKLKYKDTQPIITNLKRVSKLGQRFYVKYKDIKPVRDGYGFSIISTPKGLMTDKQARKQRLGGEVICEVW